MKKRWLLMLILPVALLIVIIVNRIDIRLPDSGLHGKEIQTSFKTPDYSAKNGFYRLLTLMEAPEVDVGSERVIRKYRQLFDPQFDNDAFINGWRSDPKPFSSFRTVVRNHTKNDGDRWYSSKIADIYQKINRRCERIIEAKSQIKSMRSELKVPLSRYEKMLDSDIFEDIMPLKADNQIPIPCHRHWLHVSRLYNVSALYKALSGEWSAGVTDLMKQIRIVRKYLAHDRNHLLNMVAKSVLRYTLLDLNLLMNHKNCPRFVFQSVFNGLTPLSYSEYGNRNGLLLDISAFYSLYDHDYSDNRIWGLFYQRNRTFVAYSEFVKGLLDFDRTIHYRRDAQYRPVLSYSDSPFWWVINYTGKQMLEVFTSIPLQTRIRMFAHSVYIQSLWDLVKISAELRLNYNRDIPVSDMLNDLNSYRQLKDPCTGKSYIWKSKENLLYSVGYDKVDNGGQFNLVYEPEKNADYGIPIILYVTLDTSQSKTEEKK